MALFGLKTKSEKKVAAKTVAKKESKAVKAPKTASASNIPTSFAHLILRPRVTEKAGIANEKNNVYTFEVSKTATKNKISHAITQLYKVSPVRINIINLPAKAVFVRGKKGTQSGVKKALVYLKKGDKIEVA